MTVERDYGSCDVCGKEAAVGVASSALGAVSFAYGRACLSAHAEPYSMCWWPRSPCAAAVSYVADWVAPVIDGTLRVTSKTLDADVTKDVAEFAQWDGSSEAVIS